MVIYIYSSCLCKWTRMLCKHKATSNAFNSIHCPWIDIKSDISGAHRKLFTLLILNSLLSDPVQLRRAIYWARGFHQLWHEREQSGWFDYFYPKWTPFCHRLSIRSQVRSVKVIRKESVVPIGGRNRTMKLTISSPKLDWTTDKLTSSFDLTGLSWAFIMEQLGISFIGSSLTWNEDLVRTWLYWLCKIPFSFFAGYWSGKCYDDNPHESK